MDRTTDDSFAIQKAGEEVRAAALDLVLRELPAESRAVLASNVEAENRGSADPWDGLWVARRTHVVGAVWTQLQVGRTAAVWPARLVAGESESTAAALLAAAATDLGNRDVRVAQALLELDHGLDAERLSGAGFRHTTDLLYLVSVRRSFPDELPECELEFEPFQEQHSERLARILEQTYEGTRDCPQLNGVRDTTDVLAGYGATGSFDPGLWHFVRQADKDIGCLLMADHPRSQQLELVYMGLTPEARGHGWGIEIVRRAQWLTRCEQRERLVLAVDADNSPAIAMYSAAGFVAWDRRSVFLRIFDKAL